MDANANKNGFFFINKTGQSTNLSRSLADETSSIQRHVQTNRKRGRTAKRGQPAIKKSSGCLLPDPPARMEQDCEPLLARAHQVDQTKTVYSISRINNLPLREGTREDIPRLNYRAMSYGQDPFNATSVPLNQAIGSLLRYYMHRYHPSQWPSESNSQRRGAYVHKSSVVRVMRQAIADELTMYCILGAAACRFQYVDQLKGPAFNVSEISYIQAALRLFVPYIAQVKLHDEEQLRQCLMCIMFLISAEAYRGNIAAAKVHLKAIKQVLDSVGGLAAVQDKCLQGQIAMADLYFGCLDVTTCLFECTYDPGPASILCLTESELQGPPPTCTAAALLSEQNRFIPMELMTIIKEVLESHTVRKRIDTSLISTDRATLITHWITLRDMAIRNRLLALVATDSRTHAIRVAIIMWTLLAIPTGRARTVKDMAERLGAILSKMRPSSWIEHTDVRYWIVLVGFCCAAEGSAEFEWFEQECHSLLGYHISNSGEEMTSASDLAERLENFQNLFLYDGNTQRIRTLLLAQKWMSASSCQKLPPKLVP